MAYWYYEGTKDFVVTTPALIVTFKASGSITAGLGVAFDAGNTSDVYVPSAIAVDGTAVVGVALKTVSDDDPVAVLVWGFAKNLTSIGQTKTPGMHIGLSGSGHFAQAASTGSNYIAGKVVSGSGTATGKFMAFIDCMK